MPATFGFSSLGALGIDVVFGPSVCTSVFGVGQVSERAVVQDTQVVIRPMLTLMLSFDERAMDAGVAARFLREVKLLLEQPPLELC
jgi:pyruvate dehydrogenase E2 component (dihydrolipoamide acetyltransferase)